jgi:hypothetical protein
MKAFVSLFVSLQLAAFAAPAQEHEPHDHEAMVRAYVQAHSSHGPVIPQPESVDPAAAKTFNITARSFEFDITPSAFVVNQGDVVTLNVSVPANDASSKGHGLIMDTYVETLFTVNRGQTRSITFTATTVGTFQFACSVTDCGTGHFDMAGIFMVQPAVAAAPTVASIDRASGTTAGGTSVTISGTGFKDGATVKFGGVAATSVSVASSTSITATTPPHAAGQVDVVVTNPDAQSGTLTGAFTFAVPQPLVQSIAPESGPTSGFTLITIHGTNFEAGATVKIGGVAATKVTVVDATTITAVTPFGPASEQVAVKQDVVVTNPTGTTGSLAGIFQYTRPPLAVTLVTPSSAPPAGGTKVSLTGAGFTTALASSITVGGAAATNLQVVDAVTIIATVPAHAAGPVDIVLNIGGTAVTVKGAFAYISAPPRRRATK